MEIMQQRSPLVAEREHATAGSRLRAILAPLTLFVGVIAFHFWSLMRYPAPFVDEAWFGSRAWGYVLSGRTFGTLDRGVMDRFDGYWTFLPWLPNWIQAQSMKLYGGPQLFPLRVLSLLFALLLLWAVYSIGTHLVDRRMGMLSVLLVSVSVPFFLSAHIARYDIMAVALGFSAVALYVTNTPPRLWRSILAGLCVSLAFEMHANGAIYGPPIVALYFLHHRWNMFRNKHFWGYIGGVFVGLLYYAALHILRYPETYFTLNRLIFSVTHTPPILTLSLREILITTYDTVEVLFAFYSVLLILVIWAFIWFARHRSPSMWTLLVFVFTLFLSRVLLVRSGGASYYVIYVTPAFDLLVAALMIDILKRVRKKSLMARVAPVILVSLFLSAILSSLPILTQDTRQSYQASLQRVKQSIKPGESIMGTQTYWFSLYDHTYYSWEGLVYYQRFEPGSTLAQAFAAYRPDIFMIDGHLEGSIHEEFGDRPYDKHLSLRKGELEEFLNTYATLIDEYDDDVYGHFRIYRINWDHYSSATSSSSLIITAN